MIDIVDEFFATDDFAQSVVLMEVSGSNRTRPIPAIFDTAGSINVLQGVAYQNQRPTVMVKTSDANNINNDSIVKVGTIWYYVLDMDDDGTGITSLTLSKDDKHG